VTTNPAPRLDGGLRVKVAVAGWRGVLADAAGRTVWTCRHSHPTVPEARVCAERERDVPGLNDLGYRLRQLRQAAGLSQQRVAAALECSNSKVSRIETGEVLPITRDIRDLADLYRADPQQRDALVAAARPARPARTAWMLRRQRQLHDDQDGAR
jgi:DNA-binding XRE family transcriptional regulator